MPYRLRTTKSDPYINQCNCNEKWPLPAALRKLVAIKYPFPQIPACLGNNILKYQPSKCNEIFRYSPTCTLTSIFNHNNRAAASLNSKVLNHPQKTFNMSILHSLHTEFFNITGIFQSNVTAWQQTSPCISLATQKKPSTEIRSWKFWHTSADGYI